MYCKCIARQFVLFVKILTSQQKKKKEVFHQSYAELHSTFRSKLIMMVHHSTFVLFVQQLTWREKKKKQVFYQRYAEPRSTFISQLIKKVSITPYFNNTLPSQLIHKIAHSPYCPIRTCTAGHLLTREEKTRFLLS